MSTAQASLAPLAPLRRLKLLDCDLGGVQDALAAFVELLENHHAADRLWSEDEAAEYLGVSKVSLWRMRSAGEIPCTELRLDGKRPVVRYEPSVMKAWARAGGCKVRGRRGHR